MYIVRVNLRRKGESTEEMIAGMIWLLEEKRGTLMYQSSSFELE